MRDAPATRRRRVLGGCALAAALLVFTELASYAGLWALRGTPSRPAAVAAERAAIAEVAPAEETEAPAAGLAMVVRFGGYEEIQPYVGFVWSPHADLESNPFLSRLRVGRLGFLEDPRDRPAAGRPEPLEVGIFGGSVANVVYLAGRRQLAAELLREPAVAARGVRLRDYALGGYKQPQQLATLAWLASLGELPDVVVNLDGFNEVALPPAENLPAGTHPLYPRGWGSRLAGLPDLAAQRTAGEAAYLRRRRRELALAFSRPLLGRSAAWNLLWLSRDRRLAAALGEAERELAARPAGGGYAAQGPAYAASDERLRADLVAAWSNASRAMHALAVDAGLPYHHFLQPNQYLAGSKPLSAEERARFVDPEHPYGRQVAASYPLLVAAGERLRERGVAFHDLTRLFADEERTVYADDCCHLNTYGNEILARAVGRAIRGDVVEVAERPATSSAPSAGAATPRRRSSG